MHKLNPLNKAVAAVLLGGGAAGVFLGANALQNGRVFGQEKATQQQVSQAEDLSTVFRDVGKRVEKSVVNIEVHKTIKAPASIPLPDDMLRRFFPNGQLPQQQPDNGDDDNAPDNSGGMGGSYEQVGTGSGVIMEVDGRTGYILTNNHVAGGATEMTITLADGRKINNAKLLGADPKSDLAVVKIEADDLTPAHWGDSSTLQQGDWIMAFGSPFGYIGSMTHGIISALNRQAGILGTQGYEDFIQVDAPINPGNSGGPLVNLHGEVVGINTAIASRSGGFQGIGFAIPINEAKWVYGQLKDHGKVTRGWLGVAIQDVTAAPEVAKGVGYDQSNGVVVEQLVPQSPANGHLKVYDVITSINGKPVRSVTELRNRVAEEVPGSELHMTVFRDGKEVPVTVKLGTQPENMTLASGRSTSPSEGNLQSGEALGMRLGTPDDEMVQKFGLPEGTKGAVVTAVTPRSAADRAHLMPGDVITQVDRHPVSNAQEAMSHIANHKGSNPILLYVESGANGGHIVAINPKR
jgi:serine protease Do